MFSPSQVHLLARLLLDENERHKKTARKGCFLFLSCRAFTSRLRNISRGVIWWQVRLIRPEIVAKSQGTQVKNNICFTL
jgi:hypothetical protein